MMPAVITKGPPSSTASRVIIDCDPGIDDMMALCVALSPLSRSKIAVEAITIVFGNSDEIETLARNARYALELCGVDGVPVVIGAHGPIVGDYRGHGGKRVHGGGAVGGIILPVDDAAAPPCAKKAKSENAAARLMVDMCLASPGEISIITLGPMTNLAAALALDPAFAPAVKSVFCMAGSCGNPMGNAWAAAEANVGNDPHAAKAVFNDPHLTTTMAGLHLTHQLDLAPLRARMIAPDANDACKFLHAISRHYVDILTGWGQVDIPVHDPTAVLALIEPGLFTGIRSHVDVEVEGTVAQGATIADWNGHWRAARKEASAAAGAADVDDRVNVLTAVDIPAFNEAFMAALAAIPWEASAAERASWQP